LIAAIHATSPLTPLLQGEGDNEEVDNNEELISNVVQNYRNVPEYVKDLSKLLRKE
jgi:hypothetical protein